MENNKRPMIFMPPEKSKEETKNKGQMKEKKENLRYQSEMDSKVN